MGQKQRTYNDLVKTLVHIQEIPKAGRGVRVSPFVEFVREVRIKLTGTKTPLAAWLDDSKMGKNGYGLRHYLERHHPDLVLIRRTVAGQKQYYVGFKKVMPKFGFRMVRKAAWIEKLAAKRAILGKKG